MSFHLHELTSARSAARSALRLVALLALCSAAFAESDLLTRTVSAPDLARLASFQKARADAVKEAEASGDAGEVEVLRDILAGEEMPILGVDIRGDYRCRVVKLGAKSEGLLPLIIYDWFRCRIDEDDIGYRLTKLTGSQRLSGHFIDDNATSLIFYGADHYADEAPRAYGSDPERDTIGRMVRVGEGRYRLEMPLPQMESQFDVLELQKR